MFNLTSSDPKEGESSSAVSMKIVVEEVFFQSMKAISTEKDVSWAHRENDFVFKLLSAS